MLDDYFNDIFRECSLMDVNAMLSGNQRELLHNVPTMIAAKHYIHVLIKLSENVPSL